MYVLRAFHVNRDAEVMMMTITPDDLTAFLNESRDSREYRRALAVKMALQGYMVEFIADMLQVSPGFVSQAKKAYMTDGVAGIRLKHQGSLSKLSSDERCAITTWIQAQDEWSIEQLADYIEVTYGVVFQSRQSYYQLYDEAGISYKKAQSMNPKSNPDLVAAKKKR
jgi:putative transposase